MPNGMTDKTTIVLRNVLNSNIKIPNKPKTVTKIMVPKPPKLSCLASTSPAAL